MMNKNDPLIFIGMVVPTCDDILIVYKWDDNLVYVVSDCSDVCLTYTYDEFKLLALDSYRI